MKCRPIPFTGPMVRATLNNRKVHTRRVVKPQPVFRDDASPPRWNWKRSLHHTIEWVSHFWPVGMVDYCPYGIPGDHLWLKETWQEVFYDDIPSGRPLGPQGSMGSMTMRDRRSNAIYKADGSFPDHPEYGKLLWRPSIFMPRWASRIMLLVKAVRVERLQDITEADAIAEGAYMQGKVGDDPTADNWTMTGEGWRYASAREAFAHFWDSLGNRRSGFTWADNPWVWVIEFEKLPAPDFTAAAPIAQQCVAG